MNYLDFFNKYDGELVEAGGSENALNQCVDLVNQYIDEVLHQVKILGTNAQDFPTKASKNVYDFIKNTTDNQPVQGDIVVFKSPDGVGHISICDRPVDLDNFVSFDENWPLKSPCKLVKHTYVGKVYNVVGWLRCKILPVEENMTDEQKRILDFVGTRTEGDVRQAFGALVDLPNLTKEVKDLKNDLKTLEERIIQLEADAQANNDLILSWQTTASNANSKVSKLEIEVKTQSDEKNSWKNRYEQALKDQVNKYTGWQLIKLGISKLTVKK